MQQLSGDQLIRIEELKTKQKELKLKVAQEKTKQIQMKSSDAQRFQAEQKNKTKLKEQKAQTFHQTQPPLSPQAQGSHWAWHITMNGLKKFLWWRTSKQKDQSDYSNSLKKAESDFVDVEKSVMKNKMVNEKGNGGRKIKGQYSEKVKLD